MRKYVFQTILGLLLICPLSLESKQFYVKVSLGLFSGGNVNDSWHLNPEHYDYTFTQGEKTNPGMDLSFEFIYQINSNLSFSLGSGYVSRSISGNTGQFIPFGQDEVVESFSCFPKLSSDMISLYITTILSFPVNPSIQLNFLGGTGYYLGNIKSAELVEGYGEFDNPSMIANRLIWKFESNANTIGFHAGAGIDIGLLENMFFSVETFYRVAKFKKFKTSVREITNPILPMAIGESGEYLGEDSTFFYLQKIRDVDEQKDVDYRISHFDYSGVTFRAGLKIKF